MKFRLPPFLVILLAPLALLSCSALSTAGADSLKAIKKSSSGAVAKVSEITGNSLAGFLPAQVKVVEVREKDLKALPSGQERALAFEKTRKRTFWAFTKPVDFKEPSLPQGSTDMDGSLLPPKLPLE